MRRASASHHGTCSRSSSYPATSGSVLRQERQELWSRRERRQGCKTDRGRTKEVLEYRTGLAALPIAGTEEASDGLLGGGADSRAVTAPSLARDDRREDGLLAASAGGPDGRVIQEGEQGGARLA